MSPENETKRRYTELRTPNGITYLLSPEETVPEFDQWDVAETRKAVNSARNPTGDEVLLDPREERESFEYWAGIVSVSKSAEQ